ncbi:MAG: hypothetical protein R3D44_12015 [Hyphomicrobiaceae bacterium]
MKTRFAIAALIYLLVQGVLFGIGTVLVLATPLDELAMRLMPWVVGVSFVVAIPLAWWLAPRLRLPRSRRISRGQAEKAHARAA